MQNYRANTNNYMRRGNYGCGCRQDAVSQIPASYPLYRENSGCCGRDDALEGMPLAMAYVPWQSWKKIYSPDKGFCRGTIFEELDKPFYGRGGCNQ